MTKEKLDKYCEQIFAYLAMYSDEPHYLNRLEKELIVSGVKITKPTLVSHLKHLQNQKIIKKKKEGKQKIAISLNYENLIDLVLNKNSYNTLNILLKEKKAFNALTTRKKVNISSACLYIIETNRLKYNILKIIEPEKTFQYHLSFQFIKNILEQYEKYLMKSITESQPKAKEALKATQEIEKYWKETISEEMLNKNNENQNK